MLAAWSRLLQVQSLHAFTLSLWSRMLPRSKKRLPNTVVTGSRIGCDASRPSMELVSVSVSCS
jgi:hypothetical protein